MNTLFILGNGFDLALNRKTKYEDYIESDFFKNLLEKINITATYEIPGNEEFKKFIRFIESEFKICKKQIEEPRWFDLEATIVKFFNTHNLDINHELFEKFYFPIFIKSINDFILNTEPQNYEISNLYNDVENPAIKLIWKIIEYNKLHTDQIKYSIYNFNYTGEIIFKKILLQFEHYDRDKKYQIINIHGSVENTGRQKILSNNLVIGGTHDDLKMTNADYIMKSNQRCIQTGLFHEGVLNDYDRFVVFGHSFGISDSAYFTLLFDNIIKRKQRVTMYIYTKDEDSIINIKKNITKFTNTDLLSSKVEILYNDGNFLAPHLKP